MRKFVFALALAGAAAMTAASVKAADDSNYLPSNTLTPGATTKADTAKLCAPGFTPTPLSEKKREEAFANYGLGRNPGDHVVDFLIPQSLGGSDSLDNLWPMSPKGDFGAEKKAELDSKLHELVCSKQLKLGDAQKAERKDWVKAYRQYVGGETTAQK